ncbi:MAG: hypothetical protein ACHQQS_02620 [Thermoanaerobaculales bacterium]
MTRLRAGSLIPNVFAAAATLLLLACATATPTETPGVDRLGATVLRYRGPEIEAVLSYRLATLGVGDDWLFLDVAISGSGRDSVEVKRDKIAVQAPAGEVVPLATQQEFGEAYPQLAAAIQRASVAAEPLDYWSGRRIADLAFLTVPGEGLALPSAWVNDQVVYQGRLYFFLPGGVQPGRYELRIDLPESKVRILFRLGTGHES